MSLPCGTSSPSDHVLCDENLARLDSFLPNSQRGQDQAEAQEPWTQAQGGARARVIQVWGWHLGGRRLQLVPWAPVGLTLAPYPTPPPRGPPPLSLIVVFVMLTQVAGLETDPEGADEDQRLDKAGEFTAERQGGFGPRGEEMRDTCPGR